MPSAEHNVLAWTLGFFGPAFRSFRIALTALEKEESEASAVKGVTSK
jgi:hypothetical protein